MRTMSYRAYADQLEAGDVVGQRLLRVNGKKINGEAGALIEGVDTNFHSEPADDEPVTLLTVWLGEAMVGLILNPDTYIEFTGPRDDLRSPWGQRVGRL